MVFPQRFGFYIILFLILFKSTLAWAILIERIVGVIDSEVITYSDVEIEKTFKLSEGSDTEILQGLIARRLLLREAERFKITETDEDIRKIQQGLQDIKRSLKEEKFYRTLGEYDLTESDILQRLKEKMIVERFIDFRINFFVVISDDTIKTYYEGHRDEFGDKSLEDVHNLIKARLFQIESNRRLEDYINQLRRKTKISVNLQD